MQRSHLVGLYLAAGAVAAAVGLLVGTGRFVLLAMVTASALAALAYSRNGGYYAAVAFAFLAPSTALRVGPVTLADLALLAAAVPAVFALVRGRRLPWAAWLPALLVFVGGSTIALELGQISIVPLAVFAGSMLLVPVVVAHHARTEAAIRWFLAAFALGVALNGVAGAIDFLTPGPAFASVTSGIEFGGELRPAGLTTHSNQLGLLSGLAAPMVLYLIQSTAGLRRSFWIAAGVAVAIGAAASGSRGGLLALLAGVGLWVLLSGRHLIRRGAVTAAAVVVSYSVVTALGLTVGLERLISGSTRINSASAAQSDAERDYRASVALEQFDQNLWTGVGFSSGTAHNFYLEVARSGGLIILVLVMIGLLGVLLVAWRTRVSLSVATPVFCSLAVWTVFAVQHNATTARFIWLPAGLAAACWVAHRSASVPGSDATTAGCVPDSSRAVV